MVWNDAIPRRGFIVGLAAIAVTGCRALPPLPAALTSKKTATDPQEAVRSFFGLLAQKKTDNARTLLTPSYQQRLGPDALGSLLGSIASAQVTDMVDALQWVSQFGTHLPGAPADRREYLVTLQVQPTPDSSLWGAGINRRFVDLVERDNVWRIDGIDITPGPLITGNAPGTQSQGPTLTIPVAQLRLGPAPIDDVIFAARQRAADRGQASWAIDPVEVTRRDGPSFGIDPRFSLSLTGEEKDPVNLATRAIVRVARQPDALLVTLDQPIRTGPGGVWAIASIRLAQKDGSAT